jgi:histidine triad (HIT) family protein
MEDCVFCRIVRGVAPASIVYSDEKVMAIMDIQPVNLGHVLITPKTHVAQLSELDEETGAHMFKIAMRIAEALRRSDIKCEGINLFLADGEAAFQEIFHVHLHVIPRFRGNGFEIKVGPHYSLKPKRETLDKIAEKIREVLL